MGLVHTMSLSGLDWGVMIRIAATGILQRFNSAWGLTGRFHMKMTLPNGDERLVLRVRQVGHALPP